jgi:hypothetical protein
MHKHHEAESFLRSMRHLVPDLPFDQVEAMAEAVARLDASDVVLQHHMAEAVQWGSYTYLHRICNGVDREQDRHGNPHPTFRPLRAYHIGKEVGLPMHLPFGCFVLWRDGVAHRRLILVAQTFEECKAAAIQEVRVNGHLGGFCNYRISEGIRDEIGSTTQTWLDVSWPHYTPATKAVDPSWRANLPRARRCIRHKWASIYYHY